MDSEPIRNEVSVTEVLVVDPTDDTTLGPMVAGFLQQAADEIMTTMKVRVQSAGIDKDSTGLAMNPHAVHVMGEHGVHLSRVGKWIGNLELNQFRTFVCTEPWVVKTIKNLTAGKKDVVQIIFLGEPKGIPRVDGHGRDTFDACAKTLRDIIYKKVRDAEI